jgi:hypothetical protein
MDISTKSIVRRATNAILPWLAEHWIAFLGLAVSVTALLAAMASRNASRQGNTIASKSLAQSERAASAAEDAIRQNKDIFREQHRPRLDVRPVAFDEIDQWMRVVRDGSHVFIEHRYKITNVGSSTARDISLPSSITVESNAQIIQMPEARWDRGFPLSFAPGESHAAVFRSHFEYKTPEIAADIASDFVSDASFLTVTFVLTYRSDFDNKHRYITVKQHEIRASKTRMIRSEVD